MKARYFKAGYGCYLEKTEVGVKSEMTDDQMSQYVYEAAYQNTESWLGMHGFDCGVCDEDEGELSGGDCCHEAIENAVDYWFKECTEEEAREFADLHNGMEEW